MFKQYVLAELPRAGLGNRLLVWAKARAFADKYNLPLVVRGWDKFSIGPWIRRERVKRLYFGYFRNNNDRIWYRIREKLISENKIMDEPSFESERTTLNNYKVFRFKEIPHWSDFFEHIRDARTLIINELSLMLSPHVVSRLNELSEPSIGLHIRMGDFRELKAGEDFNKVGAVRTPEAYFVDMINLIRKIHGSPLHVTIVTDGYRHELEGLLALKNVEILEGNSDIVDMLVLSRSKIIVTSASSTFSYWAGFLSDVPVIVHPSLKNLKLRPEGFYEGPLEERNETLVEYIKALPS
jgi:hypothetical protein